MFPAHFITPQKKRKKMTQNIVVHICLPLHCLWQILVGCAQFVAILYLTLHCAWPFFAPPLPWLQMCYGIAAFLKLVQCILDITLRINNKQYQKSVKKIRTGKSWC